MNQYKFTFPALEAYPQHEGEANVVFTVHWRLDGTDGAGQSAGTYGSVGVTLDDGEPFTPFSGLTEAQVQGWVEAALGEEQVANMKTSIDAQIAEQVTPSKVVLTPPWVAQPEIPAAAGQE